MRDKFRGKDFLTLMDFTREEINDILNVSSYLALNNRPPCLHHGDREVAMGGKGFDFLNNKYVKKAYLGR